MPRKSGRDSVLRHAGWLISLFLGAACSGDRSERSAPPALTTPRPLPTLPTPRMGLVVVDPEEARAREEPDPQYPPEGPCVSDPDCRSWFCDRGACAPYSRHGWRGNYGRECVPPPPKPHPPPPLPPLPPGQERIYDFDRPVTPCGAYLCIDGRCRSCASAEECNPKGDDDTVCAQSDPFPGKRCGAKPIGPPPDPAAPPPTPPPPPPPPPSAL